MYSLRNFAGMSADPVRMRNYLGALKAAIHPGDTVIDLGTGSGVFAVAACLLGAGRVIAIDPNPAIVVGGELARANGCADRITFVEELSSRVTTEPADVLFGDLRGVLPLFGNLIPTIVDARERLLKPDGILIPRRDTLFMALVESSSVYLDHLALDHPPVLGIDLQPVTARLRNTTSKRYFSTDELLSAPQQWAQLDYRTVTNPNFEVETDLHASRVGTAHGLALWFDTELDGDHGYSNSPLATQGVYGQLFLPFPEAIELESGRGIRTGVRATLVGGDYIWQWSGAVIGETDPRSFSQSTFRGQAVSSGLLRKRAEGYQPRLSQEGTLRAWFLSRMSGTATLGEIATAALERFPDVFQSYAHALGYAGDVAHEFSE